ncbi:MAG: hypothetical protein OXM54_14055 [Acidimicrobiaceae bacterium]|nr:hypothetical protein [Acidimicrobiaceae bacterium]MDE0676078.1 hypothetical protein [Acidimicrobiaceae bacterium]
MSRPKPERHVEQRAAISPEITIADFTELPSGLVAPPPQPPAETDDSKTAADR